MKKLTLLLLVAASFLLPRAAEGQTTFQKTFGAGTGYCVKKTSDNNLIITGGSNSDAFLLKMDQNGGIIWFRSYAATQSFVGSSVEETADGGYIVTGTMDAGSPTSKVFLLRTNSSGFPLWSKTYGGSMYEFGQSVKQTLDGGFVVSGYTRSFGQLIDVYLIKTDSNGDTLWSRNFGSNGFDYGNSILQSADSGYIVCGSISLAGPGNNVLLAKLDKKGNMSWIKSYGNTGDDQGYSVIPTLDGGYALAGYTTNGSGDWDALLAKTDSAGSLKWNISFGGTGSDIGRSIKQLSSGDYIIAGGTNSFGLGSGDFYLSEFDSSGIFVWNKTFGGSGVDGAYTSDITNDGSIFSAGFTQSFSPGGICLVKTDSSSNSGCNQFAPTMSMTFASVAVDTPSVSISSPITVVNTISFAVSTISTVSTLCSLVAVSEVPEPEENFKIFPNPASSETVIRTDAPGDITFLDMQGRAVLEEKVERGDNPVNTSNLSPAVYTVRYDHGNEKSFFSKIAIIK
jgi:hypothetical protein